MKHCHNKHHLIDLLFCKFCEIVDSILDLFGNHSCACNPEEKQVGELMVTGKDEIDISLKSHPTHVKVNFTNSCHVVPCNPDHDDDLEWEVILSDCGTQHTLHIEWNVSDIRDIAWSVCY
jgi:hypothetical protein